MEKKRGIDSFTLHILAMLFMLCDHLWATLFPAQEWMTCVGRLAFPIFAFMIAEGCYYTSNVKKYMLRLFLFAIISEIPFNLIMGSSVFYPFHQNVLWTFLLGVLSIQIIEKAKKKQKKWISFFVGLPRAFDGFSAWNHNHGRLQCCRNTDGITFLFFSQENLDFFCGTACRTVLFECSYAGESVLSGNDSGTSF